MSAVLPASGSDDEINTALKDAIEESLADDEKSKLITYAAIVPSCYDNDEKTVLVEFCGGVPGFLAEQVSNPLGDCIPASRFQEPHPRPKDH